ncbi:MAG: MgtC/SapB family protein [Bacteroidales bacterium]|nr:MgtC/SapB family protein [Candidatus Sodaliphilus aphodohippi]
MNGFLEQIMSSDVNTLNSLFKLLLSMALGTCIGLERRRKGQIAGLRTFALISMGATLAMIISIFVPQEYLGLKNGDPGRIAAQVVSGVGFLGAGAIIQMKGSVRGLTTAAGIWTTACIGLAVGAGMYVISTVATLLIIFVLVNLERIEQRHNFVWESKVVRIKFKGIVSDFTACKDLLKSEGVIITDELIRYDYPAETTVVNYMVRVRHTTDFVPLFESIGSSYTLESISLTKEVN